ncbi:hypothetical protein EGW08_006287, partial [Elysia chlorotica]
DDLDDEWWLANENESTAEKPTVGHGQVSGRLLGQSKEDIDGETNAEAKKGLKRNAEDANLKQKGKHVKKKKQSKPGQEQRKERKRITEESEEDLSKPGSAEDVKTMMSKVLMDRLGKEALEDLLP